MKKLAAILTILLLVGCDRALAQEDPARNLEIMRGLVERTFSEKEPGWTCKSVAPMEGSADVIIDQCESGDWEISFAIIKHASADEAASALREFRNHHEVEERAAKKRGVEDYKKIKEELPSLGDGGFSWAAYGSTAVAFRQGKLTVYVSVVRPVLSHDEALSKRFAHHIAQAVPR
jgi:hypothetical protein